MDKKRNKNQIQFTKKNLTIRQGTLCTATSVKLSFFLVILEVKWPDLYFFAHNDESMKL